jgi:hypothetical protein
MGQQFRSSARLALALVCAFPLCVVLVQTASATPAPLNDRAVVLPVEVATAADSILGFKRTMIAPGGSLRFFAGSGPSFQFVEYGLLRLGSQFASVTHLSIMPGTPPDGSGLEAGTAFVIGAGSTLDLYNDSRKPVTVLQLLAAADATSSNEFEVSHQVLAQQAYQLPAGLVALSLRKTELAPGAHFDWPAGMATTAMLAPLDPADAASITGDGINRGPFPVEIYVLTMTAIRLDVAPANHPV